MPILEFRCLDCTHHFEELVFKSAEMTALRCPRCGGARLQRQYSVFGLAGNAGDTQEHQHDSGSTCASCSRSSCSSCR